MVNADESHGDGRATPALEMLNLVLKVADDPSNLADHRFLHDFYFYADFYRCDRTALNIATFHRDRSHVRHDLSKTPIATVRTDADSVCWQHSAPIIPWLLDPGTSANGRGHKDRKTELRPYRPGSMTGDEILCPEKGPGRFQAVGSSNLTLFAVLDQRFQSSNPIRLRFPAGRTKCARRAAD